eukprot:548982-Alexandrium_andersonii.AAC.1
MRRQTLDPRDQFQSPRKYFDEDEVAEWFRLHPDAPLDEAVADFIPRAMMESASTATPDLAP